MCIIILLQGFSITEQHKRYQGVNSINHRDREHNFVCNSREFFDRGYRDIKLPFVD